jgi:hypothetical protein
MSKEKTATKLASGDKRTIGNAAANEHSLEALVVAGGFGSELDAAKFAMAHAIQQGTDVGAIEGASTKWNIGTVDADASLRALVESFYGSVAEPYRLIEYLINEGLRLLDSGDVPPNVVKLIPLPANSKRVEEIANGAAD